MSSAKEGRLAALRKQNWINMPSGPRDGTQRPRLMIELRAMPETRGNVTTENKRGERVTNEGKGNESLFSPVLSPFSRLASTTPPLRWIIRFSIARDHRFVEASRCWFDRSCGWNFRKWRNTYEEKKKKKRDETSGEGAGLSTNADRVTRRVVVVA